MPSLAGGLDGAESGATLVRTPVMRDVLEVWDVLEVRDVLEVQDVLVR